MTEEEILEQAIKLILPNSTEEIRKRMMSDEEARKVLKDLLDQQLLKDKFKV